MKKRHIRVISEVDDEYDFWDTVEECYRGCEEEKGEILSETFQAFEIKVMEEGQKKYHIYYTAFIVYSTEEQS